MFKSKIITSTFRVLVVVFLLLSYFLFLLFLFICGRGVVERFDYFFLFFDFEILMATGQRGVVKINPLSFELVAWAHLVVSNQSPRKLPAAF